MSVCLCCVLGCCMRVRSVSSRAARSFRPRRTAAVPMSTTAPPPHSASSSPSAERHLCSLRTLWPLQTSASLSPTRARYPHIPSVRWIKTSTVAWWVLFLLLISHLLSNSDHICNSFDLNLSVGLQCVPVLQEVSVCIQLYQLQSWWVQVSFLSWFGCCEK